MIKLKVEKDTNLLDYLLENTDYSRNKIKSLLKYKSISVNGKNNIKHDTLIKKGQVIEISLEKKVTKIKTIDVVYEDDNYLVVNKPSGMLTISTEKEKNRTLYHNVREHIKSVNKNNKIFIVHRLDRETSGIVLFAKKEEVKKKLQENWESVAVRREYVAVVQGVLEKKNDKLVNFLKENTSNMVYITKDKSGKEAVTNYKVLKEDRNSLLSILIETGRKNQIRVQLTNINHPIIGDKKYGNVKGKRLCLHANRLDIKDPITNKVISFETNIPREFMKNL